MTKPIIEFEKKSKLKEQLLIGLIVFNLLFMSLISYLLWSNRKQDKINPQNTTQVVRNEQVNLNINQENITEKIDEALRAVVSITNIRQGQKIGGGSGVAYKFDGSDSYIMTNHHVINNGDQFEVKLNNGDILEAKLIGGDPLTDLAILKVNHPLDPIEIGDSDAIQLGEPVYALGSPMGLSGTVTNGIISTRVRTIPVDINNDGLPDYEIDAIQTDAAINPGNSGGALINTRGHLIGINTQKIAADAVDNIGFAIPVDSAMKIIEQLERDGKVNRPSLGVKIVDLTRLSSYDLKGIAYPKEMKELYCVYVYEVDPGSRADSAGILKGDIIIGINQQKITLSSQLRKQLYTYQKGDTIRVEVLRNGKIEAINVTLE